jgi:hypothetical protein
VELEQAVMVVAVVASFISALVSLPTTEESLLTVEQVAMVLQLRLQVLVVEPVVVVVL